MKWFTLLAFFSLQAFAQQDSCHQDHGLITSNLDQLVEWFGASKEQVAKAPCKSQKVPSPKEMLNFISKKSLQSKITSTIHDVNFKDESPTLLKAFNELTSSMDSAGINDLKENQVKIQKTFNINPECDQVICAVKKIWGDNGLKMLYVKLKHGYNTSEIAFEDSEQFKEDELNDVILGLEDLPEHMTPITTGNKRLTKYKSGKRLPGTDFTVIANAMVILFDAWVPLSSPERQYNIFHEAGHNIGTSLNGLDRSTDWHDLSGWIKKGDDWSSSNACFVSTYGETNPVEDFAESVTAYRYNGKAFKEICPLKYEFIKKHVYKDLEYISEKQCAPPTPEQTKVVKEKLRQLLEENKVQAKFETDYILNNCQESFSNYPATQEEVSSCSLKLQVKGPLAKELNQILKEEGLESTQANRDRIKTSLIEDLATDVALNDNLYKNSKNLLSTVDKIFNESLTLAVDDKFFDGKNKYLWESALKICGQALFESRHNELLKCQTEKAMSLDSKAFPAFKMPSLFKESARPELEAKHTEKFIELMLKNENALIYFNKQNTTLVSNTTRHKSTMETELKTIRGWNKMDPHEFCKRIYAAGSIWLTSYGYDHGSTVPGLLEKCTDAQSKKTKRFQFSKQEWEELLK